jgi:hypothetical protein
MSIRNRFNRFVKVQKQKARKAYIRRQGFLAQLPILTSIKNTRLVPFDERSKLLQSMTNWQNSQWLRAGGTDRENLVLDLARINHFAQLLK